MLKSIKNHGLILAIFAAATTGLVTTVYTITKNTINSQTIIQQKKLFNQIIYPNLYDNSLFKECYLISNNEALDSLLPYHLYLTKKADKLITPINKKYCPQ